MYAMQNEMGETLEKTLKLFRKSPLHIQDLIIKKNSYELSKEQVFELVIRGYLINVDGKEYNSPNSIGIEDVFRITVKGTDYLEIRSHWWEMFRVQSVYIPVAVSFITSILSEFIKPPFFYVANAALKFLLCLLNTTY